jgi:cellulose synthase operon protein C
MMRRLGLGFSLLLALSGAAASAGEDKADVTEASKLYFARDYKAARAVLVDLVDEHPNDPQALALLGLTYVHLNNGLSAEQQLRKAVGAGYPLPKARAALGHALLLQGKLRDAFAEVTQDDVPESHAGYAARIRGRIHVAANEYPQARFSYDRALGFTPDSSLLWSDIGRFRYLAGDITAARDAAARALELDANNAEALTLAGELAREQYGLVASIPWFEKSIALNPLNTQARLELASTLGDAGRAKDMLAAVRAVLAIEPKSPRAFYLLAVLSARAGKFDLARAMLYRTNERLDTSPGVILLRALLDIHDQNDEQAIVRLKQLVEMQPGNIKARRLLGAAYARSENHLAAIDMLRPLAMRADADSYTLTLIGRAYEQLDQREESVWFLERASRPDRGEATPFEIPTSLSILARANAENPNNADAAVPYITQLVANGQAGTALAEADRLRRLNPGAPAAHILVGDSLLALGRTGEAIAAYKNAANIRFSEGTALRLVKALTKAGQHEEAVRVLDLFMGQNPRSVPAMTLASDYFMASGQWDRAIEMLERLRARLGNRDASLLNNLSWAWLAKGDKARAISYGRAAYGLAPANAAVTHTYGWALYDTGYDKAAGLALLEKAARKQPGHPGLQMRLGQAYAGMGRKAEAEKALRAALAVRDFPARKMASDLLASL